MSAVSEEVLDKVRAGMRGLQPPGHYDKVYKDECMYSFDTPESPGGLYVNLKTYQGFGEDFVDLDHQKTGSTLYLQLLWKRVPLSEEQKAAIAAAEEANKPTKLALGTDGGFSVESQKDYTLDRTASLVVLQGPGQPRLTVPLPCPDLPELVLNTITGIQAHEGASKQEAVAAWEEERRVSKYADSLQQLDTGRKISPHPADWRCDETGVTENLWLNLSTGHIGSGRQYADGSGGNGSALRHYEATGRKYPLVVKLGTITPAGADVYSYAPDEDDMVLDPKLAEHLAHWGINMMQMEKTAKTMAELEIDMNVAYEFSALTESGAKLQQLSGPGHVGLVNLGNSCYMNSVLQVLFSLPEVADRYVSKAQDIFQTAPADPSQDLPSQLAKVGIALVSGCTGKPAPAAAAAANDTSSTEKATAAPPAANSAAADEAQPMDTDSAAATPAAAAAGGGDPQDAAHMGGGKAETAKQEANSVRPAAFKSLVGKGHPEFSSGRQQDAAEYLGHLLQLISRCEHAAAGRIGLTDGQALTPTIFDFQLEDRTQCLKTSCVSYKRSVTSSLALHIPLEAAINQEAVAAYKEREAKRQKLKEEQATAYIGADTSLGTEADPASAVVLLPEDGSSDSAAAAGSGSSKSSTESPVLPIVPFEACLNKFIASEVLDDYYSAAAGGKSQATRRTRFASFPTVLVIALKRYYVAEDWTPKKLEVEVPMPDELHLDSLRSTGPAEGEQLQPEEPGAAAAQATAAPAAPEPDAAIVTQLVSMGFSENGSKRAAVAVKNSNAEAAMEWVFAHMEDPDFNDPLPAPTAAAAAAGGGGPGQAQDPEKVSMLTAMGFESDAAEAALIATSGNVERAGDWLFSHMDDLAAAVAAVKGGGPAAADGAAAAGAAGNRPAVVDGPGDYKLAAIISHMGSNTACGHYVAHIKKDGRWVIFNDEKVAASEHPPLSMGYMYVYRRVEQQ